MFFKLSNLENNVFFLPYLMGERSPHNDVNARGAFVGMRQNTTQEQMSLAVLEGVAFALKDCAEVAKENWKSLGIKNIECRVGEIDVAKLDEELEQVDVAFVDANHTYASTRAYVNILLKKMHAKSVLVVDDIHHSAEMERAWQEICADERVTSTMDLYQMGLVFFDKHYWKRHYVMKL
jgi:glycerol kinase